MLDLDFYAALPYGAWYRGSRVHPDVWTWTPKYYTFTHPASLEHNSQLTGADWLPIGTLNEAIEGMGVLVSQLGQMCLLGTPEQGIVWIPRANSDHLIPVLLAFTLAPAQAKKARGGMLEAGQTIPPANLGEIGVIIGKEGDKTVWKRCQINKLPNESQLSQRRMGAALNQLASAHLERAAWLEQWKEIQQMARKLAADYWRAYQDSQVERPKPINIWTLHQGQAALAAMTMIQSGAHASINNKGKWEREHMIDEGKHQGLVVGRYIHKTDGTENEYWMQPPEELEMPVDLDLVSQEVLKQQAKLDDLECDLSNLAPVYLLALGQEEAYISPEQIAKDLGYTTKHNSAGYGNTPQSDEQKRIKDAFERLSWLRVKTRQTIQKRRGVKPALITAEAPYLIITEWVWQEPLDESGPRRFLGWKYQITWLKAFTGNTEAGKQLGILLKKSFDYHSQKQRWEKRLARYLTIHLNVAAHKGQSGINRVIRDVLEQCGLVPTERDRRLPGEYVQQFEKAMDHLTHDGVIGDWKPKLDRHAPDFPTRAWLDLWLDSSFHVTQAPTALEAGYQKMIDARQARQDKQK